MPNRYRQAPERLIQMRAGTTHRWLVREYGLYVDTRGRTRRFGYQVVVSPQLGKNRRLLGKYIRDSVGALKEGNMPEHEHGQTFSSFEELMQTRWYPIKEIIDYDIKINYKR